MTIREIAKSAGVSMGTVSRYLSGCKLKERNETAVKNAIERSGYRVNYSARALRSNKTYTVGIAVYRFEGEYSGAIADSASDVLEKNGYVLLVCSYNGNGAVQNVKLKTMKDRFIDGLIFYPSGHDVDFLEEYYKSGIPIVAVNEDVNFDKCDKVGYDGFSPFFKATNYLIGKGHKNICILGGTDFGKYSLSNVEGYLSAMEKNGLSHRSDSVLTDYDYGKAYREARERLERGNTTAVIAVNDLILQGVLDAASDLCKRIPEDISVIGCYSTRHYRDNRITFLKVDGNEVGSRAARLLLNRIADPGRPYENIKMEIEFCERSSVADLGRF